MPWRVNEDKPDWTTIHYAASMDGRCQPQEKKEEDGQWHNCQTVQGLLELIQIIVTRGSSKVKACRICHPVIPAQIQPLVI